MTISYTRTGRTLSDGRLNDALGTDLPGGYRDFMLGQNGGVLTVAAHLPDDTSGASVRAFLVVDDIEGAGGYDFGEYLRNYEGRYPHGLLPVAVDASSNLVLLDTGYEQPGSVWFWDHEGEADEDEPPRTDNIIKIAASFTAFLKDLTTDLTDEERAKIDRMVQSGTFTPGTFRADEPFTFGGRPEGE